MLYNWSEVRYKIERTRKEYAFDINGYTIALKEVFNSKGENIFCIAKLLKGKQEIEWGNRQYSPETREQVIDELTRMAQGKKITGIDPINGQVTYK